MRISCSWMLVGTMLVFPWAAYAAFPEYQDQQSATTFIHSAIMTSDNVKFWDTRFARHVDNGMEDVNEVVFAFMECFGGGMFDELRALNNGTGLSNDVYTSAARHNQPSLAGSEDWPNSGVDPLLPGFKRTESFYNLHYGPAAGGGAPSAQRAAAKIGYDNDIRGPVRAPLLRPPFPVGEIPQYVSGGAVADAVKLHRSSGVNGSKANDMYLAILFGGSTQLDVKNQPILRDTKPPVYANVNGVAVNWNTLNRIHDALLAAGYTEDEMYIMYPGGEARNPQGNPTGRIYPGGPVLPTWIDAGTRAIDLQDAWTVWLNARTTETTQVFFWSSWGHGTRELDVKAKRAAEQKKIQRGTPFSFDMDTDLGTQMLGTFDDLNPMPVGTGIAGSPDIEITTSMPVPSLQLALDGVDLPLVETILDPYGDGSEYRYKFGLTRSQLALLALSMSHDLEVDYDPGLGDEATFILQMGPTTGDLANNRALPQLGTPPLDHFQCYETKRRTFTGPAVTLRDTYGSVEGVFVQRPEKLCAPANKNDEDPSAPFHPDHLVGYRIRHPFTRVTNQHLTNQFGDIVLDVLRPDLLMVPSAKDLSAIPSPITPSIDHFQCYRVRTSRGTPHFAPIDGVTVQDQFATSVVKIVRPARLCVPVSKNGETPGAQDHPDRLLCYKTRGPNVGTVAAFVGNQFGGQPLTLVRRQELCVPTTSVP